MSKKLFMGFALALALVGCSQEEELVNMSGEPLKDLTGEIVEAGSRTHLGSDGSVLWSAGDKISLFKKNGYHQSYQVKNEGVGKSSTGFDYVAGGPENQNYTNDLHYAVYPFDADHRINSSEKKLTLDLSSLATQSYTSNTFENGKAVMVAKSNTTQLAFTNAFSLANVQLTGEQGISPDEKIIVKNIKVSSATKVLAGTATVDMNQDKPAAVFDDDDNNGSQCITLNCGTGVELTTVPTNFYILMPAVTFPAGDLTVTIYATVAGEEKEYVSNLNNADAPFYRSTVTTLPKKIEFEDWAGSTEATIKNVENVTAANDALQNNTGVDIADATESTPITVPAKTEDEAAKEHTIDLSDAKMPTGTPVQITVVEGDASSSHTVKTLKVVVPEGTTANDFTINAPGTTVILTVAGSTEISTLIAETADETLVISSGITVNMLKVKKGNVRIEEGAKVNAIERDDNNKDAATYVIYEGNTRPTITINGEYIILVPAAELENYMVAKISDKKYLYLQKAIEAVQNGETITFINDVKQKDGVLITDKNLTIDLNGKTFTVTEGASTNNRNFKINGSSVVTIKNGTMVAAGEYSSGAYGTLRTEGTANVTLTNVKLYNYRGNGLNVKALTGTTVTINNTEVYSQYGGGIEAAGGTIELNDVTVEQKGMYTAPYNSMAISVNGGGTVTVNSGTYTTECLTAEEANNQGTSHGPWAAGVLNSGGTLIIKGGTFTNDNYGENSLATYARGLLLADTGANIQIKGGTFNALKKIVDIQNNLGDASKNPKATISGGDFSSNPLTYEGLITLAENYVVKENNGRCTVEEFIPTAKVGNKEYGSIEEAIEAWTHNTTLTLLSDVTLTDVITLKSTEHHILDLGTYTMTAASGKNAIVIQACGTGDAERTAITIKANANNPGGINAGNKSIIYYKYADGGIDGNDRPIIKIEGGVFTGSTSSWGTAGIYTIGTAARKCATLNISGGTFNCSINGSSKSKLLITGGVFHYSVGSQGDSTALRLISGGTFKTLGFMTADSNNTKFWFGTSMGNSNVGLYINDEGYLVVGGPVITEFSDKFAAKATNATKWSSYLEYSSAAANGLYYTNADMAIQKHGAANVVLK